jgi:hypothetical protein
MVRINGGGRGHRSERPEPDMNRKKDRLGHREERNESMKSNQNRKITHSTVYGMVIEKNGTNP